MSDKYKHIKLIPIKYKPTETGMIVVYLNGLICASVVEDPGKGWIVQMRSFEDVSTSVTDKRAADNFIRRRCWDWLCDCIDPVHAAATAEITDMLSDFDPVDVTNKLTGTRYA